MPLFGQRRSSRGSEAPATPLPPAAPAHVPLPEAPDEYITGPSSPGVVAADLLRSVGANETEIAELVATAAGDRRSNPWDVLVGAAELQFAVNCTRAAAMPGFETVLQMTQAQAAGQPVRWENWVAALLVDAGEAGPGMVEGFFDGLRVALRDSTAQNLAGWREYRTPSAADAP